MYSNGYMLGEEAQATTSVAPLPEVQPVVPQQYWKGRQKPFPFPRMRMQPKQQTSNTVPGGQFYDHQMALAAQQNVQMQQAAQAPTPEPSGIGGISWPVIALAGGGFLMLMMVMMSGKK